MNDQSARAEFCRGGKVKNMELNAARDSFDIVSL